MMVEDLKFDPDGDIVLVFDDEPANGNDQAQKENLTGRKTRMLVSSKHLSLASPVFKAMLKVGFREGQELSREGTVTIPLPEDCPKAFGVLMTLVHAKYMYVPSGLSLSTLTNLAVLVDKYQVHDCVGPLLIGRWVEQLGNHHGSICFDSLYSSRIPLDAKLRMAFQWITISWIFNIPYLFAIYTRFAMLALTNPVDTTSNNSFCSKEFFDYLPIPQQVFDKINSRREQHLNTIFKALIEATDHLQDPKNECCKAPIEFTRKRCRLGKLRSWERILTINGLNPLPEPPYKGLSIISLQQKLGPIHVDTFCGDRDHEGYLKDGKGAMGYFERFAGQICQDERGLSFEDPSGGAF